MTNSGLFRGNLFILIIVDSNCIDIYPCQYKLVSFLITPAFYQLHYSYNNIIVVF